MDDFGPTDLCQNCLEPTALMRWTSNPADRMNVLVGYMVD